ncbi:Enolase-phosphatase E1 [Tyrophagus putrescentiae]|nr:Enolase-phosphatase E1 [Tyrophagus putrescentiae]
MSNNQVTMRVEKPSVILLDIEGTMTDISFVSKKLFPFIKANIETYFDECYARPETQELIKRMRESRRTLSEEESACLPQIQPPSAPRREIIKSLAEYSLANMRLKRRVSEIKQLQILVWVWGYERGSIRGHVYDEVTTTMHHWKTGYRIALYVFSTGMIAAQQLLLCCTNHGNCLPMITDFFDNSVGDKTDPGQLPEDCGEEASAAIKAGCKAFIIKRPGNKPRGLEDVRGRIPIITSFEDIQFE